MPNFFEFEDIFIESEKRFSDIQHILNNGDSIRTKIEMLKAQQVELPYLQGEEEDPERIIYRLKEEF